MRHFRCLAKQRFALFLLKYFMQHSVKEYLTDNLISRVLACAYHVQYTCLSLVVSECYLLGFLVKNIVTTRLIVHDGRIFEKNTFQSFPK